MQILSLIFVWGLVQANVAVYWGQNSGGGEKSLASYCQSSNVDIVLVSFLYEFPNLALNFGGQCNDQFSDGTLHCSTIGEDIKTCQGLGKKVLLSLGGATGTYGFSGDSDGKDFADVLWNKFGGGTDPERPFDDAIVDGFDFDIENKDQNGYVALANELRQKFSSGSKQYYLSAAPQCVYPDESVGDLLSQVSIDFAFIQFYNNYCSLAGSFNWNTWKKYATTVSPNKDIKLYVGLPGQQSSAGSGYVDASAALEQLNQIKSDSNFGGVSFWDASSVFANGNFLDDIVSGLSNDAAAEASTSANDNAPTQSSSQASSSQTSQTIVSSTQVSQTIVSSYTQAAQNSGSNWNPTTLQTAVQSNALPNTVTSSINSFTDATTSTTTNVATSVVQDQPTEDTTTALENNQNQDTTIVQQVTVSTQQADEVATTTVATNVATITSQGGKKQRTKYITEIKYKTVYYTAQ